VAALEVFPAAPAIVVLAPGAIVFQPEEIAA